MFAHVDHSHLSEHAQVLGHLRLGQPEQRDEIVDGALPAGEDVQDLPPPGSATALNASESSLLVPWRALYIPI